MQQKPNLPPWVHEQQMGCDHVEMLLALELLKFKGLCFALQDKFIKILRGRSYNQQTCSFPKGKFNLSRAHRNAFIADLHLAILLWSCFHSIISQILDVWFYTLEGYKVVGISCNGNKSNFYLQSTLISVIQSKHILGLTTSLILQINLQYKLGPAGQLAMLNEKCVIRKMYFLWYSLYMVLFCTSNYFDYFTNKAWQFFLLLLIKRVFFFVCLFIF